MNPLLEKSDFSCIDFTAVSNNYVSFGNDQADNEEEKNPIRAEVLNRIASVRVGKKR